MVTARLLIAMAFTSVLSAGVAHGALRAGAAAVVVSLLLWVLPHPDRWVAFTFLALEPLAIGSGVLVLWIYRGHDLDSQTIALQRIQAKVAILLGACAVVAGYIYVMLTKAPFTPVG